MAGDWIKMNKSLPRDPRVIRISSALKADRLRTVGGLFSAWCIFDEQTEDGILPGYTPEILDELVTFPGLARAMESVGWLEIGEGFLAVPRFDEHNGQSAKRRAQDANRKQSARAADKCPAENRTESRPEKRRGEETERGGKREEAGPSPTLQEFLENHPTDTAVMLDRLVNKINGVKKQWRARPHFTQPEMQSLRSNARYLDDLKDTDWNLLGYYMRAEIPKEWGKYWRPDQRSQFIENISDVCNHADRWKRKCTIEGFALNLENLATSAA